MAESNAVYSYPEYDDYNYDDYDDYDDYGEYNYNDDYSEDYQDSYDDYDNFNDDNYRGYDNDFHEEKITQPEPENEIVMTEQTADDIQVINHSDSKGGSVLTIMLVSVLAAGLLGSVVYTLDRRNTVYNTVTSLNKELSLAEAENVRLQSELESKMSAKNVEDYAENVLGMRKMDTSQIKYIKIQTDDVVNIPEQEKGFFAKVKGFFNKCVEYFRG